MKTERGSDVETKTERLPSVTSDARDSDPNGTRPTVRLRAVPAVPPPDDTPAPDSVGRYSHVYGRNAQGKTRE
jgi:hypothetical protein